MSMQKESLLFVIFNDECFRSLRVYRSDELEIYIDKKLYKTVRTADEFWDTVLPNGLSIEITLATHCQNKK